ADLVHAAVDVAGGGCSASAGCGQSTGGRGVGEMRRVGDAQDIEGAVVAGNGDARYGDELADAEAVRGERLNCCGGASRSSATGIREARRAGEVRELSAVQNGDDGKRAVVARDADTRDCDRLACGEAVSGGGGDGDEESVFAGSRGAREDRDSRGLGGARWTCGDCHD